MNEHPPDRGPHQEQFPVPGLDPIAVYLEGRNEDVPSTGYLISARIGGSGWGEVTVTHYGEINCSAANYWDSQKTSANALVETINASSIRVVVARRFEQDFEIEHDEYGGLRPGDATTYVLSQPPNTVFVRNKIYSGAFSQNLQRHHDQYAQSVTLHRVVGSVAEVPAVLEALALGMGLNQDDRRIFVENTTQKLAEAQQLPREVQPQSDVGKSEYQTQGLGWLATQPGNLKG